MYFSTQLQRELLLGKYPLKSSLTTLEKCRVEKWGLLFSALSHVWKNMGLRTKKCGLCALYS
jgi:hypothetical protein